MPHKIHEGHLGIKKYKKQVYEVVYSLRINNDIAKIVENCYVCLKFRPCQQAKLLQSHPVPSNIYEKVALIYVKFKDLFDSYRLLFFTSSSMHFDQYY